MIRKCPICHTRLVIPKSDYVLKETTVSGHPLAIIGTPVNASASMRQAIKFQIAANLAAYTIDDDAELNLGFRGTAWIQCPEKRKTVTYILQER